MSRFDALKKAQAAPAAIPVADAIKATIAKPQKAFVAKSSRSDKKAVVGYFSPAVRRGLHQLAVDQDSNIQALLGEAIDLLMRHHGRHPFGER